MRLFARGLTKEDRRDISGWQYAAPFDVYNETAEIPPGASYHGLADSNRLLVCFFCWGDAAQVPAAQDLYTTDATALDFGIGLRPELTGEGLGLMAASYALAWLRDAFHPPRFRLSVKEWNIRAQKVYARLGFSTFAVRGDYLLMQRDERPFRNATRALENGMPVYPADPEFERHLHLRKEECGWDMSVFSMAAHSGTHIDAPAHVGLPGGVETIDIERLSGTAQLLDWPACGISAIRSPRVLLRTGSRGFSLDEAQALMDAGVTVLGVDGLSVGEGATEHAVHALLLANGVVILENAALEGFSPGWVEMRCLPLLMPGSDGAPVRLLLREEMP